MRHQKDPIYLSFAWGVSSNRAFVEDSSTCLNPAPSGRPVGFPIGGEGDNAKETWLSLAERSRSMLLLWYWS